MRFNITGALGPEMSVLLITAPDGSPSFFWVNAFTKILYSLFGPIKRNNVLEQSEHWYFTDIELT